MPYKSGPDAFRKARAEKLQKYEGLRRWMIDQEEYGTVTVDAIIVGALGSWDPENEDSLRALGISYSYSKLFRKLCCVDTIKGSHAVWKARR